MPNTLVHIGLQGPASRLLMKGADPKWIYLGLLIPDLPWVLQRTVLALGIPVDLYSLRLFAIVQSSLALSLILSAAFATIATAPGRVFTLLGLNAVLHLLVDACETKWGNGVHLLAPISWKLVNFGIFWPESVPAHLLTIGGAVFVVWAFLRPASTVGLVSPPKAQGRGLAFVGLLGVYCALPIALMRGPEATDSHSVATLRDRAARPHRAVAFDRAGLFEDDGRLFLVTLAGEELQVSGGVSSRSGTISARGTFLDEHSVVLHEVHEHRGWPRELMSAIGLALIAATWLRFLAQQLVAVRRSRDRSYRTG